MKRIYAVAAMLAAPLTLGGCPSDSSLPPGSDTAPPDGGGTPDSIADGAATCPMSPGAPSSTWDTPLRTMPWFFSPADVDAGTPEPVVDPATGCTRSSEGASCSGLARVYLGPDGPQLQLPGFGLLYWNTVGFPMWVAPPALGDGNQVWVSYSERWVVVCPVCGAYAMRTIEIRDRQDGRVLWLGREGAKMDDLPETTQMSLFGVTATTQAVCSVDMQGECHAFQRTVFDHQLDTAPPTLVHHDRVESIATPGGSYQILWAYSQEQSIQNLCVDGPDVASATGFAASLRQ